MPRLTSFMHGGDGSGETKRKDEGWPLTSEGDYAPEQSIGSQLVERRERGIYIFRWLQVRVTGPRDHLASSLRIRAQGI